MSYHYVCVFYFVVLLVAVRTVLGGNVCFDCERIDEPAACKAFKTCPDGQFCYHEVIETDDRVPKYTWGCASKQLCSLEMNLSGRGKRLDVEKCFECCDSNFCNYGPCTKDYCSSVTCQNNGTCVNQPLGHLCQCPAGYAGLFCETEINECQSFPCKNGANCTDEIGYYTCSCLPGYGGMNCEIDINECASDPCTNQATCVDQVDGFMCTCVPGFTGRLCETNIDECSSSPCHYNGTCIDGANGYQCDCISGIVGDNCEINIDDCANVTCLNGGVCGDLIDGFECTCNYGFTGQFCETSLGRVCYLCETGIDDPYGCTARRICGKDEECYTEQELLAVNVTNYRLGCVATDLCTYLANNNNARGRKNLPVQLCYECCDQNECNKHACNSTSNDQSVL